MNTSLRLLSLALATGLPVSAAASLAGIELPTSIGPGMLFHAFVVALTLLTFASDYAMKTPRRWAVAPAQQPAASRAVVPSGKARHALAA